MGKNNPLTELLKSMGRTPIDENSKEYTTYLKKIAKDFDGETRENQVFCKVCKTKISRIGFNGYPIKCLCKCETDAIQAEETHRKNQENMRRIEKLRKCSLLGSKYKNVVFETSKTGMNPSFDKAFSRCFKYAEIHTEILKSGNGIYLYGNKGIGKTHITACVANALLSKCVPVLFTNLFEISKAVKATFKRDSIRTEQDLIEEFGRVSFLFFDDLGTEIFTKGENDTWLQGLLFDLINKRYNNNKPTVFSSNYDLNELVTKRGIMDKTVDRIREMTSGAAMKITGESLRNSVKSEILF